jgi:hypothetical protein
LVILIPDQSRGLSSELLSTRAEHFARRSEWSRAAADFREAGRLCHLCAFTTTRQVLTLLASRDREEAQRVTARLLERILKAADPGWRETSDPLTANSAAWCVVLAPGAVADYGAPEGLAEMALDDTAVARKAGADILTKANPNDRYDRRTQQIIETLELPIPMPFSIETPLDDVLKHIKQATTTSTFPGIPIFVDPIGLQQVEKSMISTVKINLDGVPLKTTLRLILKQLGLTYSVKDGFLMITSEESQDLPLGIRVDPVADATVIPRPTSSEGGTRGDGIGDIGIAAVPAIGAVLFRAGRFEDAIRRIAQLTEMRKGKEEPVDWAFLSMAHHRLGHRDDARRWLDRLRSRKPGTDRNQFWNELAISFLQSEAEALVLYDPVFPADPFAH